MKTPSRPSWYKPISHNYLRRASWHDYRSRCVYMITFSKDPAQPPLSALHKEMLDIRGPIYPELTKGGMSICAAMKEWQKEYPFLEVRRYTIMPDHVHFILMVKEVIEKHLGYYINKLKGMVSRRYWHYTDANECMKDSLFAPGYNDRILTRHDGWKIWDEYIIDNPRRLLVRMVNPEFFHRGRLMLPPEGGGESAAVFHTYGNSHLADYPHIRFVKISSRFTAAEIAAWREECLNGINEDSVIASAFIHPEERKIGNEATRMGARIIHVVENPFKAKEKPEKSRFNLCSRGKLLIVALNQEPVCYPEQMTKPRATLLNNLAKRIARIKDR